MERERKESRIEVIQEFSQLNVISHHSHLFLVPSPEAVSDSGSGDKNGSNRVVKTVLTVPAGVDESEKNISLQRQAGGSLTAMTVQ